MKNKNDVGMKLYFKDEPSKKPFGIRHDIGQR